MRPNGFLTTLGTLAAAATLTTSALAVTSVSIGQLAGSPGQYDHQQVSVTGWVRIRGDAAWLQLCDDANTCIYLANSESSRASVGQRLTFYGEFRAHDTLRYTPVSNVLQVQG